MSAARAAARRAKREGGRPSRAVMPDAGDIASYWAEWQGVHGRLAPWAKEWGWDVFEPSCMACGIPFGDPDASPKWSNWNGKGLERCHVVPRSAGGLDIESNLVLMCKPCHNAQPQSDDPDHTWQWMRERTALDRLIGSGYLTYRNGELVPTKHGARSVHEMAQANGHRCVCPKCDDRWTTA